MASTSATQRYRNHKVWETLTLKRGALNEARFDEAKLERWRTDIVEWLDEATKTRKVTRQPALYVHALAQLQDALNALPTDQAGFREYVLGRSYGSAAPAVQKLLEALWRLPLPPPKELASNYVELLDDEIVVRTKRLDALKETIDGLESLMAERTEDVKRAQKDLADLRSEIAKTRQAIEEVAATAMEEMRQDWGAAYAKWLEGREATDSKRDAEALEHMALLAATAKAGADLAEHAAGTLTASEWKGRASRERNAALWMRGLAVMTFLAAGGILAFMVIHAIEDGFDLTLGDGILRGTITVVLGAFAGLLFRESGRHFREADTAEEVALSMQALAPFYAGAADEVKTAARARLGEAVLVKNVLSRFAHRDAAKHATDVNIDELPDLIKEATQLLRGGEGASSSSAGTKASS